VRVWPAALLCLAACATTPAPDVELAAARGAIIQAEPAASRHAQPELRLAQDKLSRAEQAAAQQRFDEARRLAEQAEVDAHYARALAEAERSRSR
jgi:hypothetical protein